MEKVWREYCEWVLWMRTVCGDSECKQSLASFKAWLAVNHPSIDGQQVWVASRPFLSLDYLGDDL